MLYYMGHYSASCNHVGGDPKINNGLVAKISSQITTSPTHRDSYDLGSLTGRTKTLCLSRPLSSHLTIIFS